MKAYRVWEARSILRCRKQQLNPLVLHVLMRGLMAEALQDEANVVLVKPISFTQLRDLAARLKLLVIGSWWLVVGSKSRSIAVVSCF